MQQWTAPTRPNDYVEHSLVTAILDGTFSPGTNLPGERALAAEMGVTRPTLREAIQRLARDGWLTVQQGKSTVVNDFWRDGGLNVLSAMVQHGEHLPPNFVTHLLEVRRQLAPAYTAAAVSRAPDTVAALLKEHESLPDTAVSYANFDWQLHRCLTISSGNPIYTLILNGFADFYVELASLYFERAETRALSRTFYADLATAVTHHDVDKVTQLSQAVMEESIKLWQERAGE